MLAAQCAPRSKGCAELNNVLPFRPRRRTGPRLQSMRSKIEPPTAHSAFISYYFNAAAQDERLTGPQHLLLLELSILAADASGRPLGYSFSELGMMYGWNPSEVRADAEACARLHYLDLVGDVMLLRDPRDLAPPCRRARQAAS